MSSLDVNFVMQKLETLSLENAQLRDRVNYLESIFRNEALDLATYIIRDIESGGTNEKVWQQFVLKKLNKLTCTLNRLKRNLDSEADKDGRSDN